MMEEFIHWPVLYLLLLATCGERLSRMIEIWMNICNTVNLLIPPKNIQGMTNNVGLTFSVGDTISWFTISIKQDK